MFRMLLLASVCFLTVVADDKLAAYVKQMDRLENVMKEFETKKPVKKTTRYSDMTTDQLIDELKKEIKTPIKKDVIVNDEANMDIKDVIWKRTMDIIEKELAIKSDSSTCNDANGETKCKHWKDFCNKPGYAGAMKSKCRKTCGYCVDELKACTDTLPNCKSAASQCTDLRVSKYCPQTCGSCKAKAPPKCSSAPHGCCWDKNTAKDDEKGSNCPTCENKYDYVCKRFVVECTSFDTPGQFMREYCPESCNICSQGAKCEDHPDKAFYCPFWKNDLKWCHNKESLMLFYCPKTCEFC